MDLYVKQGWPRHAVEEAAGRIEIAQLAQAHGVNLSYERVLQEYGTPSRVLQACAQYLGEDPAIFAEPKPDAWESTGLQEQFGGEPFPEDGIVVRDDVERHAENRARERQQLEAEMAVQEHIASGWTQADMERAADEQSWSDAQFGSATNDLY